MVPPTASVVCISCVAVGSSVQPGQIAPHASLGASRHPRSLLAKLVNLAWLRQRPPVYATALACRFAVLASADCTACIVRRPRPSMPLSAKPVELACLRQRLPLSAPDAAQVDSLFYPAHVAPHDAGGGAFLDLRCTCEAGGLAFLRQRLPLSTPSAAQVDSPFSQCTLHHMHRGAFLDLRCHSWVAGEHGTLTSAASIVCFRGGAGRLSLFYPAHIAPHAEWGIPRPSMHLREV